MAGQLIVLIPAAGVGARFGSAIPKQYTVIAGKTVLEHSMAIFLQRPDIARVAVVVSPEDGFIEDILPARLPEKLHIFRVGGASRAGSVFNGINTLLELGLAAADDHILVHDAARCCLPQDALQRLIDAAAHPVGALLALPVADTLKRADGHQCVTATVSRQHLWQAQTPQLFQAALLQRALAAADFAQVTDEASAVEQLGLQPLLVEGDSRNLKMTLPQDEAMVRLLLESGAL